MKTPTGSNPSGVRLGQRPVRGAAGGYVIAVERRRAPARRPASPRGGVPAGPITLTVMRAMIAAADELRLYLATRAGSEYSAADLRAVGTELADLVRRYQGASRRFLRDWLQSPAQTSWLVDSATGRVLDLISTGRDGDQSRDDQVQVTFAEDQPLHGLRTRYERPGIGVAVVAWRRRQGPETAVDLARFTAALTRTAVVCVAPDFDRRVRSVRVLLNDPGAATTFSIGGGNLPLAADFTAAVAQTIGRERRPAARAYGAHDAARRGTIDGFVALTPFTTDVAPLVLMEGAGLPPLMVARIANEVAGDPDLRRRFQVWLYRFPMTAPLFFSASKLRTDLEQFCVRFEAATGSALVGRVTVVAHGAGAVLAKTLVAGSGTSIWDAAFVVPMERVEVRPTDRALLELLYRWTPSTRIERVIIAGEPRNAEALTAGVGVRAIQLLKRQSPALRSAIERIYGSERQHLRAPPGGTGISSEVDGSDPFFTEPVCQALAGAALASDRALLALLDPTESRAAAVFTPRGGLTPTATESSVAGTDPLGPQVLRRVVEWLRPSH
jgi:hypothetical protein